MQNRAITGLETRWTVDVFVTRNDREALATEAGSCLRTLPLFVISHFAFSSPMDYMLNGVHT